MQVNCTAANIWLVNASINVYTVLQCDLAPNKCPNKLAYINHIQKSPLCQHSTDTHTEYNNTDITIQEKNMKEKCVIRNCINGTEQIEREKWPWRRCLEMPLTTKHCNILHNLQPARTDLSMTWANEQMSIWRHSSCSSRSSQYHNCSLIWSMSCQFSSTQNVSHLHLDISSHPHHSCYELWLWKWSLVFIMFIDDDHHRRQIATILTINPKRYFNKLNVKCKRKMIFFFVSCYCLGWSPIHLAGAQCRAIVFAYIFFCHVLYSRAGWPFSMGALPFNGHQHGLPASIFKTMQSTVITQKMSSDKYVRRAPNNTM